MDAVVILCLLGLFPGSLISTASSSNSTESRRFTKSYRRRPISRNNTGTEINTNISDASEDSVISYYKEDKRSNANGIQKYDSFDEQDPLNGYYYYSTAGTPEQCKHF